MDVSLAPSESSNQRMPAPVKQQTSALAIISLILGCLSLLFWLLTAIPSIICGIIALVKIGKSEGRLGGTGLAIAGLCTSGFLSFILTPILIAMMAGPLMNAREAALRVASVSNMKQVGKACFIFTSQNKNTPASIQQLFDANLLDHEALITNPLTQRKDYVFLPYDKGAPGNQIIMTEGPGTSEKGLQALFVDGHVNSFNIPAAEEQARFVEALRKSDAATLREFRTRLDVNFFIPGDKQR